MSSGELPGTERGFDELVSSVFGARPTKATIEIADRCNESCVHCYQVQGQKGEMTSDDVFAVLDHLADAGILFLTVSGGEATLRSDFLDVLRHARRLDFAITLFTNGLRITEEMADALAEVGLRRVEISLYDVRAEVHDWVTNVPGSWEKTVAAVRRLTSRGVPVRMKTPQMAANSGVWGEYRALAASLGADAVMDPNLKAREDGERFPEQLRTDDEAFKELFPQLDIEPTDPSFDPERRKLCGVAETVHVEPNGELRPCAMLDFRLGDARDGLDGHQSSEIARVLRGLRWSDLPFCGSCAIAHHCSRCHAQSLHEVGDALAPYPDACHSALLRWELETGRVADLPGRGEDLVGPFERNGDELRATPAPELTLAQRRLYASNPWLRRETKSAQARVRPGDLVQLRRPGRRPKKERIPVRSETRAESPSSE